VIIELACRVIDRRAPMTGHPPNAPAPRVEEIARSLAVARREAAFTAIMTGLTEPFMTPFALALGATRFQVGLLSSVRHLVLSLIQLWSADAVGWLNSRKRLVLWTATIQLLLWLPLAFVGPLLGSHAVAGLIVLYTAAAASGALGGPAWGSLMAEYLPPHERGRFFGHRARVIGLWTTVAGLAAGGLLELSAAQPTIGFGLLCLAAAVSRLYSLRQLAHFHEEPWKESPHVRFSFWQFVRQVHRSNVARFAICIGALNFATHLAAPFFAVYMLQELHYGYLLYTSVHLASSITGFVTGPGWGRLGDRVGNYAVLRTTVIGVSVLPLLWTVSGDPGWIAFLNVAGALLWGGLNLAATNFLYDAVSPPKRHTCLAYFNVINGTCVALGAFVGGWAISVLPPIGGSVFLTIFVTSTLTRFAPAIAFRRLVHEVRPLPPRGMRAVVLDLVSRRRHLARFVPSHADAPDSAASSH
jgi:MFS family permease